VEQYTHNNTEKKELNEAQTIRERLLADMVVLLRAPVLLSPVEAAHVKTTYLCL